MNALLAKLEAKLGQKVRGLSPIGGGDINDAYLLEAEQRLFVKTRADAPPEMYACEAEGLCWLAEANALPCPRVVAVDAEFLVLEYVAPGARRRDFDARLGRGLATLHRAGAPYFGHARDNFIANLPQVNTPAPSFAAFYREHRLGPLVDRLELALRKQFDRLYPRLSALIPDEPPARLHGDLWSGNVHTTSDGQPMLIDPAVYGGAREGDLA
ncbi:MAG TPA: fructosamine kinase family protein, partial [Polyangiales bacterium]